MQRSPRRHGSYDADDAKGLSVATTTTGTLGAEGAEGASLLSPAASSSGPMRPWSLRRRRSAGTGACERVEEREV